MVRAKICGLTREADVDAVVAAGADAVGFVVDVPVETPREVSVERAAALASRVPPFVTSVLVTMPSSPQRAIDLVDAVSPDAVQCHGDLPPGDVAFLRSQVGARVLTVVDADDVETARRYEDVSDALLVDSVDGDGGGGTGETHDWNRTRDAVAELDAPVVLAGGLTPENVGEAIATVDPYAVDVASGVEATEGEATSGVATGGEKDHGLVREFVAAVEAADRSRVMSA